MVTLVYLKAVATVQSSGYSFLKDVATGKNGRIARDFSGKSTMSLKLCYLCPYDIRNGTIETCSKRTDT